MRSHGIRRVPLRTRLEWGWESRSWPRPVLKIAAVIGRVQVDPLGRNWTQIATLSGERG